MGDGNEDPVELGEDPVAETSADANEFLSNQMKLTSSQIVGAVADWAFGSTVHAVAMIVALIMHLKIVEQVRRCGVADGQERAQGQG